MSPEQIKKLAAELRNEHPALQEVDLESILVKNISDSGMDRFLHSFTRPTAWISGLICLYIDGVLPENDLLKLLSGLTIGAAVEWASDYVKRSGASRSASESPVVRLDSAPELYTEQTKNLTFNLLHGTARDLKSHGFMPRLVTESVEQREHRMTQAVYRHAMSNPKLLRLIV
jgi:hypothetical protein